MGAKAISSFLGALLMTVCLTPAVRANSSSVKQCKNDGKDEFKACRDACQEAYQVSKDMCRNISHDCAETCRAARQTCTAGPLDALDACKQACATQFDSDKAPCTQLPKDSAERDACVDAAQVKAFQCRDTCRENLDGAALAQCRKQFTSCIKACPPPPQ